MKLGKSIVLLLVIVGNCIISRGAVAAPSLWLVTDEAGEGQAYLFGSVHFGAKSMYPLSEPVMQAFAASEILAVELDLEQLDSPAAVRRIAEYGIYPPGVSLIGQMSFGQWQQLAGVAESLGLSVTSLERLKPWLVAFKLANGQLRQSGFSERWGVDNFFLQQARARAETMDILALETLERQLAVFENLQQEQQMKFLQSSVQECAAGNESLAAIVQAWSEGDEASLEEHMLNALDAGDSYLHEELYLRRNEDMLEQLVVQLQQGRQLFVVVGAGHVVGDHGLRALLAARGYRISRIQ